MSISSYKTITLIKAELVHDNEIYICQYLIYKQKESVQFNVCLCS